MSLEVHATYSLPADRDLWAQAIEGADSAIIEAAKPAEYEWTVTEPGSRSLVFVCSDFYSAFYLKERLEVVSLHGIAITVEIRS